ncbi:MAG TPA: bifunctional phosphoribosylaminoimidazolecarboxamide formyltransferase/IMP cyclohydrolase [Phycisphaerales bacterium]|nr:bifunctional phosphoribosylaminoimidazolecarboxamide formyltransferase/IMP cyclohydrolase [Phycisphaerales bacterium]
MPDLAPVRRALVSVSDKTGLVPFVQALAQRGVEIVSTGGTASALRAAGIKVTSIDDVTGFPEIMGGRVKTLHPKVHGGLLGVRDDAAHAAAMQQHGIAPIDLVCVNLYPFEQTIARPGVSEHDAIENIDIGGPSMLRSAAKNFEWVTVCSSPSQYQRVLDELHRHNTHTTRTLRCELAGEVYALTSRYDAAIAGYLCKGHSRLFPVLMHETFVKDEDLRYGENPHQSAALYRTKPSTAAGKWPSIATAEQLHGKELSYNNINDAVAALELVISLNRVRNQSQVTAAIVKHTNPCGASIAANAKDAIDQAIAGDPIAAYGGILALGDTFDEDAAERLQSKEVFLEVIVAPRYTAEALEMLRARWANVRLLAVGDLDFPVAAHAQQLEYRSIPGGLLVQERDLRLVPTSEWQHAAGPKPTQDQLRAAAFLEPVCRSLFSNAVVLGGPATGGESGGGIRMYGGGAGQMDRVTSCRLAVEKAGKLAKGSTAFSDAFFPFSDGPQILIDAGVTCIVHPGGSKRDQETFDLCNQRGVTCLTTGVRHFRH